MKIKIPCPTQEEVNKYLSDWKKVDNLRVTEDALNLIFKTYKTNTDLNEVLAKVYFLNAAFGAGIRGGQLAMARHIKKQKIDKALRSNDLSIVSEIRIGHGIKNTNGTEINFYSFATKYCSFHRPDIYPLFDSNVERALRHFKKHCPPFTFPVNLRNYEEFVGIIKDFKEVFNLDSFSFRDIDKYLYLVGRKLN